MKISAIRWNIDERTIELARFVKLKRTLLFFPLVYAGSVLAMGCCPPLRISWLIITMSMGAWLFAMSINGIFNREMERKNPRKSKELSLEKVGLVEAWLLMLLGIGLYVLAAWNLSEAYFRWSWIPGILFLIYPVIRRVSYLFHFFLGIIGMLLPFVGWFVIRTDLKKIESVALLSIFMFFWLAGFDIIPEILDEEFCKNEEIPSIVTKLGRYWSLKLSSMLHFIAFFSLVLLYLYFLNGPWAAFFLMVAGFFLFLEHILVENVDLAYFKINVVTSFVVLFMIILGIKCAF